MELLTHPDMPGMAVKTYTDEYGVVQTELVFTDMPNAENKVISPTAYEFVVPQQVIPKPILPEVEEAPPVVTEPEPVSAQSPLVPTLKPVAALPCTLEIERFDTALDNPKHYGSQEAAKTICASCVKLEECRQYALDNEVLDGVWGGLSAKDRKSLLKQMRRASRRLLA
jgi:hypothetical protein